MRILIADDSATMRQLVSFTLEEAGHQVVQAVDGKDAMHKATAEKFDLLVTDLHMPIMDGIELIRSLRATVQYRYAPMIMLTTESDGQKRDLGRMAGASGWIVKPFSPPDLVDVVKRFAR